MKLRKGVTKTDIDRANKILEKHLGDTNNTCAVIGAIYTMGQTIEKKKGLKRKEKKRKENKNQEGPNRTIQKLKELREILAQTSNEIHRRKIKRNATKKKKEDPAKTETNAQTNN